MHLPQIVSHLLPSVLQGRRWLDFRLQLIMEKWKIEKKM